MNIKEFLRELKYIDDENLTFILVAISDEIAMRNGVEMTVKYLPRRDEI